MESLNAPEIPPDACDSHIHVFDPRFRETLATDDTSMLSATAGAYQSVQKRLGTSRAVVVTPRNYDVDNAVTLDAIRQLGPSRARGVATVRPDVTDDQLEALHTGGIRGIRFTLYTTEHAPTRFDMVETLAHRVHELGWHLQLHWTADQIVEHCGLLERIPTSFVFDHFARLPMPGALFHPACDLVTGWLVRNRAWVKLSAPYLDSRAGETGHYSDVDKIARQWVGVAPSRVVWGSDWPHTSMRRNPDPASLLSKLVDWVGESSLRHRVLVDNPAELYGFQSSHLG